MAHPLRALLRPGAEFPPNPEQVKAIEGLKKLMLEQHLLAVSDEAAAIAAASAWLPGRPPEGRPYEVGADTSGIAIGGVTGQCSEVNGKLKVLCFFSGHLSASQQHWHQLEQEFLGVAKR